MEYPISRSDLKNIRDKYVQAEKDDYLTRYTDIFADQILMTASSGNIYQMILDLNYIPDLSFKYLPTIPSSALVDDFISRLQEKFPDTSFQVSADKSSISVDWS